MGFDDIIKNFTSIFIGIVIAIILITRCLVQPHILNI